MVRGGGILPSYLHRDIINVASDEVWHIPVAMHATYLLSCSESYFKMKSLSGLHPVHGYSLSLGSQIDTFSMEGLGWDQVGSSLEYIASCGGGQQS